MELSRRKKRIGSSKASIKVSWMVQALALVSVAVTVARHRLMQLKPPLLNRLHKSGKEVNQKQVRQETVSPVFDLSVLSGTAVLWRCSRRTSLMKSSHFHVVPASTAPGLDTCTAPNAVRCKCTVGSTPTYSTIGSAQREEIGNSINTVSP